MASNINFDQLLDVKGFNCPMPIVKTKKAMDNLSKGQVLNVETTDPGSKNDMTAWARSTGNEIVRQAEGEGAFIFYIRKTA